MKKKITKFYFFKKKFYEPATAYLFCFTKRFVKHTKRYTNLHKYFSNSHNKKQKKVIVETLVCKNTTTEKMMFNQWNYNEKEVSKQFIKSYYTKNFIKKTSKCKQWFLFKLRYNTILLKQILFYSLTGIISSHFIHFLLKKNLAYQAKSKYNSEIFNLIFCNTYIKLYATYLTTNVHTCAYNVYNMSISSNQPKVSLTENYLTKVSDVVNIITYKKTTHFIKPRIYLPLNYNPACIYLNLPVEIKNVLTNSANVNISLESYNKNPQLKNQINCIFLGVFSTQSAKTYCLYKILENYFELYEVL